MNKNNTYKLWEKYPTIFAGRYLSLQESLIPFGFECGDGWYNLIDELCETITIIIGNKDIKFVADQVKEKFGGLRFYYHMEGKNVNNGLGWFSHLMIKFSWVRQKYWKFIHFRQKFYKNTTEKIEHAIRVAEHKSYEICEICGKNGKLRGKGWLTTQCDKCWSKNKKVAYYRM